MAFTYTPATPTDLTRVRFHLSDTVEASAIFTDDEINFCISEATSWQGAVIMCIKNIIARMSANPNFTADWLRVDYKDGIAGWQRLLTIKSAEFGYSTGTSPITVTAVRARRSDVVDGDA
jgi:hypothetical protein